MNKLVYDTTDDNKWWITNLKCWFYADDLNSISAYYNATNNNLPQDKLILEYE